MNKFKNFCVVVVAIALLLFAVQVIGRYFVEGFDLGDFILEYPKQTAIFVSGLVLLWAFFFKGEKISKAILLLSFTSILYFSGAFRQDFSEKIEALAREVSMKFRDDTKLDGADSVVPVESEATSKSEEATPGEVDVTPIETGPVDTSKYPTIAKHITDLDKILVKNSGEASDITFLLIAWKEWKVIASESLLEELREFRKADLSYVVNPTAGELAKRRKNVLATHYFELVPGDEEKVRVMYDDPAHHAELAKIRADLSTPSLFS